MRLWSKDFLELDWSICLIREKKNIGQKDSQKLFPWSETLTCVMKALPNCTFGINALPKLYLWYERLTHIVPLV